MELPVPSEKRQRGYFSLAAGEIIRMDRLDSMRAFVRIVEAGSLTAAARELEVSLPAVARALSALERRLGARLINRTTRSIRVTEAGTQYYEHCRGLLAQIDEVESALSAQRTTPTGTLRVSAPVMFGRLHVAPLIPEFLESNPGVLLELTLVDRLVNLIDEGFDVAVRIGELADSSLVATRLGTTRRITCASRVYLRRRGRPKSPQDLTRHDAVRFTALNPGQEWRFRAKGRTLTVRVLARLSCNNADAAIAAAVRGFGVTTLLSYQAEREVAGGVLEIVLKEFEPPPIPIHAVCPHGKLLSAKTRAFVDFLVERLRK